MTSPARADADERLVELPSRGARLRCQVRGSGPALLLCAGTGYPLDTWPEAFLAPLAASRQLVLFDYRGTGGSPGTDDRYSTPLFAADAAALLEALGIERADVMGHSMGGRVAQHLALDAPERVRALVLVASGAGEAIGDGSQEAGIPLETAASMIESGYRDYLADNISRLFFPADLDGRERYVEDLVEAFWEHRPGVRDYLKHVQARQRHHTADRLADISCPTLVLVGERDDHHGRTGPHIDQSRFLAERIPGARLEILPEVAHGLFWQAPERTADAIGSWLAEARPAG